MTGSTGKGGAGAFAARAGGVGPAGFRASSVPKESGRGDAINEGGGSSTPVRVDNAAWSLNRQHFLYFLPLPQGHGSLRPDFMNRSPARVQPIPSIAADRRCIETFATHPFREGTRSVAEFYASMRSIGSVHITLVIAGTRPISMGATPSAAVSSRQGALSQASVPRRDGVQSAGRCDLKRGEPDNGCA